jgi:transposase
LDRFVLNDAQWARIAELIPGKTGDPGRSGADNRLCVEAVLWIVRTSAPWRDLPATFGHWNSVFRRFRRWAVAGVFERMFKALREDPDFEYVIADGTIVRVHQKATGATYGPPVYKCCWRSDLSSLHQRIRSQACCLAKMAIRASRAS